MRRLMIRGYPAVREVDKPLCLESTNASHALISNKFLWNAYISSEINVESKASIIIWLCVIEKSRDWVEWREWGKLEREGVTQWKNLHSVEGAIRAKYHTNKWF